MDFKLGSFIGEEGNISEFMRFVFSEKKYIIFIIVHDDEFSQNELLGNFLSEWGVFWVGVQFKDFPKAGSCLSEAKYSFTEYVGFFFGDGISNDFYGINYTNGIWKKISTACVISVIGVIV